MDRHENERDHGRSWQHWREIPRVVLHPPHLRRTILLALVVGTVLFVINQLDVVLSGAVTKAVWLKAAVTYVVPFCVSNYGILVATRRRLSVADPAVAEAVSSSPRLR